METKVNCVKILGLSKEKYVLNSRPMSSREIIDNKFRLYSAITFSKCLYHVTFKVIEIIKFLLISVMIRRYIVF